jgi:thiol-disulfide isomerase/thioredoxin
MKKLITLLTIFILSYSVNAQIKDFTMTSTDGVTYNLFEELNKGKTIVLDFFSTTCGSCQDGIPPLERAWNQYFQNGTYGYVWSIEAAYRPNSVIDAFMEEYEGTFPAFSIINDDSVVNDTFGYYVPYTPYYYIICPTYKMYNFTISELDKMIEDCGVNVSIDNSIWKHTKIYAYNNSIKFFDLPSQSQHYKLQLIDITGKQILNKTLFEPSGEIKLPEKINGVFVIRLQSETASYTTKIMIN